MFLFHHFLLTLLFLIIFNLLQKSLFKMIQFLFGKLDVPLFFAIVDWLLIPFLHLLFKFLLMLLFNLFFKGISNILSSFFSFYHILLKHFFVLPLSLLFKFLLSFNSFSLFLFGLHVRFNHSFIFIQNLLLFFFLFLLLTLS